MSDGSSEDLRELTISEASDGMRYDQVLARELGLSRNALEPLFEAGGGPGSAWG